MKISCMSLSDIGLGFFYFLRDLIFSFVDTHADS